MPGILIFGGTVEGRQEAERLHGLGESVTVSVTSRYARTLLPGDIPCRVGALDESAMREYLKSLMPEKVIDATHPFAVNATRNIQACCRALKIPYARIERPKGAHPWLNDVMHVKDSESAAKALCSTEGNVLLTTGSNTLKIYCDAVDPKRLWARVLPTHRALSLCEEAGLEPSHIIAMQGPFSAELNDAIYAMKDISVMVTKDSGDAGGVSEKVAPALAREIQVIMIDRPGEDAYAG